MPLRKDLHKVMVIGSGPIVIGQAAEFDYAGTQACRALREEGLSVVLVNSNPATIMTDANMADKVYIEPLTVEFLTKIIEKERPDGLLPTLGGQTGLNLATKLAKKGVLDDYGVELLGTPLSSIEKAEDRELFKNLMKELNEPVPESAIAESMQHVKDFVAHLIEVEKETGLPVFPIIVRPAYTLGGTGGGIAYTMEELHDISVRGFRMSMTQQLLLERCLLGWKEVEYEVMRDGDDNCITICNMENFDPMGIHTGDSIVIAPSQTLSDKEYQMLRTASLKIIRALGIWGGCNVQLALDPNTFRYYVIEVNPRVSRSSALASKATGYPIARVAAKIAVGLRLDEIQNAVTKRTLACFEPALDYVVLKIPRWPFDKFNFADRRVTTQMKATGEVMAIDRTFEGALMKAVRSLEIGQYGLTLKGICDWTDMQLEEVIKHATDQRLFAICEGFRRGMDVEEIHQLSCVDVWFLEKVKNLVDLETEFHAQKGLPDEKLLRRAKEASFNDHNLAEMWGVKETEIRALRKEWGIQPVFKFVDTCAAEFESETPYYYSTYESENELMMS